MKKILFTVLFIGFSLFLYAQGYIGIGTGAGLTGGSPAMHFEAGWLFGKDSTMYRGQKSLNLDRFIAQFGYHSHIDSKNPAIFNVRFGREVQISPNQSIKASLGYGYQVTSNDNPSLNRWIPVGGFQWARYWSHNRGSWFIDYSQLGAYAFVTVGLKGIIR